MKIINSTIQDIDEIFRLYKIATDFQKTRYSVHWPEFEPSLVKTEINENRQWKTIINNEIACVFATTFSDPLIWEDQNTDPSVYIHRIAASPNFRGQNLVTAIVNWAKVFARENKKEFIRLDTVGENLKLIDYYKSCGFAFLGLLKLKNTEGLPPHYKNAVVSLFEMKVKKQ